MGRLISALVLVGALSLAVAVPSAAAQSYGPGLWAGTWYGPFLGPGLLNGPYGSLAASGFGATGFGCGMGAYGFSNYGYGQGLGLGLMMPTCGGFGAYPYLYPYYTGYPFSNAVGALGGLALAGIGNPNPFFLGTCDALAIGGNFTGFPPFLFPGAAGQYNLAQNVTLLNLSNPSLSTLSNFGTFGAQGLTGCVALR